MELSYNVNTKESPVNSKVCGYAYDTVTFMTDCSKVQSGTKVDVKGKRSAVITVSGTFVADVIVMGYYDETTTNANCKVKNVVTGEISDKITQAGCYLVDVSNVAYIRARCNTYTSGSVTVTGIIYAKPLQEGTFPMMTDRNVMITALYNVSVAAGASPYVIENIKTSQYAFVYVVVRADAEHSCAVSFWHRPFKQGSLGSPLGLTEVLSGANFIRGASDWDEVKGDQLYVQINSKSAETRKYDVYLYGVR